MKHKHISDVSTSSIIAHPCTAWFNLVLWLLQKHRNESEGKKPSTSLPAWDVDAKYFQNCTGCSTITVLQKVTIYLSFLLKLPKTSFVINCSSPRTTRRWFKKFSQQQWKHFYFWCYKDSSSIYKVAVSSSWLSEPLQEFAPPLQFQQYLRRCSKTVIVDSRAAGN